MEAVVAQPDDLVGYVADKSSNTGIHAFGAAFEIDIRAGTDLPVDAPDAVGLGMDQDGRPGMGGMVEEETRSARRSREARTSAIRKRSSKERPGKSRCEQLAQSAAGTVTGEQITGRKLARTGGGFDFQGQRFGGLFEAFYEMVPAQVNQRLGFRSGRAGSVRRNIGPGSGRRAGHH